MNLENNIMVPMRDGVRLATKLIFPDDQEAAPWPVIAIRTPYDKEMMPLGFDQITGDGLCPRRTGHTGPVSIGR